MKARFAAVVLAATLCVSGAVAAAAYVGGTVASAADSWTGHHN